MAMYFIRGHRGLGVKLVERWAMLDHEGAEMGDLPPAPPTRAPGGHPTHL
jgi:hypothetical protein